MSRTTLYRHFASVTDLLDGVAADLLARARFDRLLSALEVQDPVRRAPSGHRRRDRDLANGHGPGPEPHFWHAPSPRRCRSSTSSNSAASARWSAWWRGLHQAGRLRDGLTRAGAADLLLVITAFAAWDELRTGRNRSPAAAAAAITGLAVRAVVTGD